MSVLRNVLCCGALIGLTALVTTSVVADDTKGQPHQMSPEEQKMMENWMPYMTPGPEHQALMKQAGSWKMTMKMRFSPDMPWSESTGTAVSTPAMGGRYLFEKVSSPPDAMMPEGFEGFNICGYDNFKKKHTFCWIDSAGTGMMIGEGDASADGKTITYKAECPDMMTGKMKKVRFVTINTAPDTMKSEMHETGPDGKEFQSFEATYTRTK